LVSNRRRAGVTLLEMMIVMVIIAIMAGAVYPSVATSLEGIRLSSSADDIVAFLNGAAERANRHQAAVEVFINKTENSIVLHSTEAGFERRLDLPSGVLIQSIEPVPLASAAGSAGSDARHFYIYPGGTVPRIGILIANRNGAQRLIRMDPITGAPKIERGQQPPVSE
jgi:prepilin-type N-terminal cleavage/methylation domain-containing protein